MDKQEILNIVGDSHAVRENSNRSAVLVFIESLDINVVVTIPYYVSEIFFEVKDKTGKTLFSDSHDFYGYSKNEDFNEALLEIADIIKTPELRLMNNGKTIQAKGYEWYYWIGEFDN